MRKNIFIAIILGIVLFFSFRLSYITYKSSSENFLPKATSTKLQPPRTAVQAIVNNIKGVVKKEGREDTMFNPVKSSATLVEGEALSTENGSAVIHFPNIADLAMQTDTEIDYLNALPDALVVRQPVGSVSYITSDITRPFSIRSLGLLVQVLNKASFTVVTDAGLQTVSVAVKSGSVTLAYSDVNNTTQVIKVTSGHSGFFNYSQSTLAVR